MLKPVEKKKAYEDIVRQIRTLIEEGKLKRNDHLPSERDLSETFGVSRTTVREAIRTLESMRLLQSRQGDGTYVLASSEEALVQPLAAALFHEKDDILDIFYIRKVIEPYVAQLAARNATAEEIGELEEILERQAQCLDIRDDFIETDSSFHNLLAKAAKNRVMERLLMAIVDLLRESREKYLGDDQRRARRSLEGHRNVLAAIKTGDGEAAHQAMLSHLEDIEGIIVRK